MLGRGKSIRFPCPNVRTQSSGRGNLAFPQVLILVSIISGRRPRPQTWLETGVVLLRQVLLFVHGHFDDSTGTKELTESE